MAQKRYGVAIRLDPTTKSMNGSPNYLDVVRTVQTKLADSIMQSWANVAQPAINPFIRLRIEPKKLYCDLIATDCELTDALKFRNEQFDENRFRANLLEGIVVALSRWRNDEFDQMVISSVINVELVTASG